MHCLVLGAGIIGVTTAYELACAGYRVSILDRCNEAGLETSFANGGQLSATHTVPWSHPDMLKKLPKLIRQRPSPFIFHVTPDIHLWSWLWLFLRNCTTSRACIHMERAMRLALYNRRVMAEVEKEVSLAYNRAELGILHLYQDRRELEEKAVETRMMNDMGCERRLLDPEECIALEPALEQCRDHLAGGIHSPEDTTGDAYLFTRQLAAKCREKGVRFHFDTTIHALDLEQGKIVGVNTDKGRFRCDCYVMALGSYSALLLRRAGIRLPIYPGKGYSVTIPLEEGMNLPKMSLIDEDRKIVCTSLGNRFRIAGTLELDGYNTRHNKRRCQMMLESMRRLFPAIGRAAGADYWAGLRPMTPDFVPVIGRTSFSNLFLNTGHGTLGWTMACASARIITHIIDNRSPDIDVCGLGPERFG